MSKGYAVTNPATNEVVETFDTFTDEQIQDALAKSHEAFQTWRKTPIDERAKIVSRAAELFKERKGELAKIEAQEMGKATPEGEWEINFSGDILQFYADNAAEHNKDKPVDVPGGKAVVRRLPVGSLLGIMPWNFPVYQVARFVAPNLVLGNTILLKHAEINPQVAQLLEELFTEAGLPEGVYQNVFATHDQISTIIADPRVQGVSLTGSERAGATVAEQAGRHLKKVVLELGGSDPYIVLSAPDARAAARDALATRMGNWGQACNSNKRMIVMEDLYDDFVDELVQRSSAMKPGDPTSRDADVYGPLSSESAADGLTEQIAAAKEAGATVHVGGERVSGPEGEGFYVSPAVITDVDQENPAYTQELFGMASVVYKVSSAEEAVALANDSQYGLGGAVFSTDLDEAKRVADQLEVGMANVNLASAAGANLPFGGVKRSGFGRELGPTGLGEYVEHKHIYQNTEPAVTGWFADRR